jgi:hypothetical protein
VTAASDWNKTHIIHRLARARGYRRYLEICTPITGGRYAEIDPSQFGSCRRLMYRCASDFHDGLPVDYRSADNAIDACLDKMRRDGAGFDIALVDSWHLYATSWRDLDAAFRRLEDGGTLVVHDCLPTSAEIATPEPVPGAWCGVSYQAYVDFVGRDDLEFYTVDIDYGCGVIRKRTKPWARRVMDALAFRRPASAPAEQPDRTRVLAEWREKASDHAARFSLLQAHTQTLLHLISLEEFLAREPAAP